MGGHALAVALVTVRKVCRQQQRDTERKHEHRYTMHFYFNLEKNLGMMSCVGAQMQMGLITACELSQSQENREHPFSHLQLLECIGT